MKLPAPFMFSMLVCIAAGCPQQSKPQIPVASVSVAATNQESEPAPEPLARKVMSEPPTEYLDLHGRLIHPDWSKQAGTVRELKKSGDLFTIYLIAQLQKKPRVALLDHLDEVVAAIQKSQGKKPLDGSQTLWLLEVCAFADITCHITEVDLKRWTMAYIKESIDVPEVRAELESIAKSYESELKDPHSVATHPELGPTERELAMFLKTRVRSYARHLLKPPAAAPEPLNQESLKAEPR